MKLPIGRTGHTAKCKPMSGPLGSTLDAPTSESCLNIAPIDTNFGEAFGEKVSHFAVTEFDVSKPPKIANAEFPRSINTQPGTPIDVTN
ncbi:hypothetical protein GWG54_17285 [Natronococcus sp. JC468]|uniref:hypothetical protein n=1 Tax=Natronococcus sp. JC468 TaxID=1961921 RepID=UPI00143C2234|nr:hypothetical protein [Natronococcus sp. JC468]NKE37528.1 hypothetical protein [Natronococcus sp. JC468]